MGPEQSIPVEPISHVDGGADTGVQPQVAAENVSGEVQVQPQAQPESDASQQGYNWKQANDSLASMKAENSDMRKQLQALNHFAMQSQQAQQQQQQQQQQDSFFQGREQDDPSSVGDIQGYVNNYVNDAIGQKTKEFQLTIDALQVKAKDPDFKKKIETYQQFLTPAQKQYIVNSSNPWSEAYDAVVNSAAYYRDQISQQASPSAQRIADNATKPGSLSSVGTTASLSRSEAWENYSDADIIRMGDRYANGG